MIGLRQKIIIKNYMTSYKKSFLKTESKCISGQAQESPESPVSMDQSVKDTRDTSDHKCILIRNPAYKYKHYKFLKSEGLVGTVPVQRLPQNYMIVLPSNLQFIHYKVPANFINKFFLNMMIYF